MAISSKQLEEDMFDTMWAFLQMGKQKANYPMLKELCMELRQMMMQKTAGQRKGKKDISFDNLERVKNGIVVDFFDLLSAVLGAIFFIGLIVVAVISNKK